MTDRDAVFQAVRQSHQHFGRLAVILSNAGYGLHGAAEEVELDDVRANFETNVFGTLSVIQAALPLLRAPSWRAVRILVYVGSDIVAEVFGQFSCMPWKLKTAPFHYRLSRIR